MAFLSKHSFCVWLKRKLWFSLGNVWKLQLMLLYENRQTLKKNIYWTWERSNEFEKKNRFVLCHFFNNYRISVGLWNEVTIKVISLKIYRWIVIYNGKATLIFFFVYSILCVCACHVQSISIRHQQSINSQQLLSFAFHSNRHLFSIDNFI